LLVEDILCRVEEVIGSLLGEVAEEVWQKTVKTRNNISKPKDTLTSAERKSVWAQMPVMKSLSFQLTGTVLQWSTPLIILSCV
jgi:hypothetical protein